MSGETREGAEDARLIYPSIYGVDLRVIAAAWDAWLAKENRQNVITDPPSTFAAGFLAGVAHAEASARLTIARLQDERDRANLRAELRDRFINGPMERT